MTAMSTGCNSDHGNDAWVSGCGGGGSDSYAPGVYADDEDRLVPSTRANGATLLLHFKTPSHPWRESAENLGHGHYGQGTGNVEYAKNCADKLAASLLTGKAIMRIAR